MAGTFQDVPGYRFAHGQDGTWTTRTNPYSYISPESSALTAFLRSVNAVEWKNVRGVRIAVSNYIVAFHLYGSISPTESQDRLRIVDIEGNDMVAQLDFGNIPQRSSMTRQFRVINNSASKSAANLSVSLDVIRDASPSLIGQYQISNDNIAFANAINIGDLAPGQSSEILYIRNNTAANSQPGPWTARIIAHAVSWS